VYLALRLLPPPITPLILIIIYNPTPPRGGWGYIYIYIYVYLTLGYLTWVSLLMAPPFLTIAPVAVL